MSLIERYLAAVAAQLSTEEREDIIAELRDLLLSRMEERGGELGRPLDEREQEEILRELGHPLVVAARYRPGPEALVGPELFPYWMFAVKCGLMLLFAVELVGAALRLIGGAAAAGDVVGDAIHGLTTGGLTLIGLITVTAAALEHYGVRPSWLVRWRAGDLQGFGLSDPKAWSSAAGIAGSRSRSASGSGPGPWPGSEHLFPLLATGIFVLWWAGLIDLAGFMNVAMPGEDAAVRGAPVWDALHGLVMLCALGQLTVHAAGAAWPSAHTLHGAAQAVAASVGLVVLGLIFQAGHWFTLDRGGETARVEGGLSLLTLEGLGALGGAGRDLGALAANLSVVFVWLLAAITVSLIFQVVGGLRRSFRR